jgi:hypothetical protein
MTANDSTPARPENVSDVQRDDSARVVGHRDRLADGGDVDDTAAVLAALRAVEAPFITTDDVLDHGAATATDALGALEALEVDGVLASKATDDGVRVWWADSQVHGGDDLDAARAAQRRDADLQESLVDAARDENEQ